MCFPVTSCFVFFLSLCVWAFCVLHCWEISCTGLKTPHPCLLRVCPDTSSFWQSLAPLFSFRPSAYFSCGRCTSAVCCCATPARSGPLFRSWCQKRLFWGLSGAPHTSAVWSAKCFGRLLAVYAASCWVLFGICHLWSMAWKWERVVIPRGSLLTKRAASVASGVLVTLATCNYTSFTLKVPLQPNLCELRSSEKHILGSCLFQCTSMWCLAPISWSWARFYGAMPNSELRTNHASGAVLDTYLRNHIQTCVILFERLHSFQFQNQKETSFSVAGEVL